MSAKPNESSTVTFYPSFQALAAATAADSEERVRLRPATDYPAEDVAWLWPEKIPVGKLTLLIGDPGLGKSLIAIDVAARVTRGLAFPDCTPEQRTQPPALPGVSSPASTYSIGESAPPEVCLDEPIRNAKSKNGSHTKSAKPPNTTTNPRQSRGLSGEHSPGSVLILSAEDQIADTIRPRLDAAGADPAKVFFAAEITDLRRDLNKLAQALDDAPDCRLIIVDPVNAFVGPSDSHFHTIVRKVLTPLAELAAKRKIAILAVTHLRKNPGAAITRATGSMAFAASARCIWTVMPDEQNPGRNLLLPVKNNLGPKDPGLAFSIEQNAGARAPNIHWHEEPIETPTKEAIASKRGPEAEDRKNAARWLGLALADGPRESYVVLREGKQNGFQERTLQRALHLVGGITRKKTFNGGWLWSLTANEPEKTAVPMPQETSASAADSTAFAEKPVAFDETCRLRENLEDSTAENLSPSPAPSPASVTESIRFLKQLDKNRDGPPHSDPDSPTGHPALDQLLADFRNGSPTSITQPSTLNSQPSNKKSARSHSRLPTGTDSWHFTRPADPCESGAMHLGSVSAQALDESNTRRRADAV